MSTMVAWIAPICAIIGMATAMYLARWVLKQDPGTEKMDSISKKIQTGAKAFLFSEYKVLIIFVICVFILMCFTLSWVTGVAFITGGFLSAAAGYVGMHVSTRANTRTTAAARTNIGGALKVAFRSGLTMGLTVASFGLMGISLWAIFLIIFAQTPQPEIVNGFAMGASSIALFARVGGGIYTKAADVGADLVGKVEKDIPEDDPRNPATIADNVGDNVGDVAGMGADLYESYVGSILAPIILAVAMNATDGALAASDYTWTLILPLLIAGLGIIASIIGLFVVKTNDESKLHAALNKGTYTAAVIELIAVGVMFFIWKSNSTALQPMWLFGAVVLGLAAGLIIGSITEYFCSDQYKPTQKISESANTGAATVIISGISTGMRSVFGPIIAVCIAIIGSYILGTHVDPNAANPATFGMYAVALSALGMLSITAITVGVDAYGPVADNAGGIAEMAGLPEEVRDRTDKLDSVGNTTAAIAKGFAIGSAGLTALSLFVSFQETLTGGKITTNLLLTNPWVVIGLFIGAMLPFLFAALTMGAVSRAANKMVEEVRRQFREIPGIMEGTGEPDTHACVAISTQAALHEMILPGIIAVAAPILIGILNVNMLGGMLAGALVTGFLLAIFMANSGGAWDNAKKYIEGGHFGGKGSEQHKAAIVGDTVGDPFKDTSGPSMNILIKLMTVVSLVFAPVFINLGGGVLFNLL